MNFLFVCLGVPQAVLPGAPIVLDLADPEGDARRIKEEEFRLAETSLGKAEIVVYHCASARPDLVARFHWACGDIRYGRWAVSDQRPGDGSWTAPELLRHYVRADGAEGSLDAAVREWQQLIISGALQRPLSLPCPSRISRLIVWSNHTQAETMPLLEVSNAG